MGSKLLFFVESLMFGTGLIVKCTRLIHSMICVTEIPSAVGPLLSVLDEAPLQHKMLNFGLFQAKTDANGL